MKSISNHKLFIIFTIVLFFNAACGIVRNPFRESSNIPFNSEVWKKSDAFEKGRMFDDIIRKNLINGQDKDELVKLLGEPDKKRVEEGNDIYLYKIEVGHNTTMPYLGITIDKKMGAYLGAIKNGTGSILVAE